LFLLILSRRVELLKKEYVGYGLILVPLTPILNTLPIFGQNLFYPSDAVVLLVILCYLGSLFSKSFRLIRTDIDLPFMGYSLVASLAVLVSLISKGDMAGNVRLLKILFESCLVYYITVSFLTSRKDLMNKVILAIISFFFIISALAVYKFLRSGSVPGSVFNDSEALGIYLTLVLPLILGLMLYGYSGTGKALVGIIFSLGCAALFLSSSRAGWISGAITLSILGVHRLVLGGKYVVKNDGAGKRKKAKAFLAIPALSGVLYYLWFYYVQGPIRDVFYLRFMSIFSDNTFGGRVDLWESAWRLIQDSPLLGHGPTVNVYNLYLQTAAQFGLVALILFLFVFMKFFGVTFGRLKNIKSSREFGVVMGGALGVLGLLIVGMAESALGSRMSPLFWMQVGMVMALQKMADNRQGRASGSHLHMSLARNNEERGRNSVPTQCLLLVPGKLKDN